MSIAGRFHTSSSLPLPLAPTRKKVGPLDIIRQPVLQVYEPGWSLLRGLLLGFPRGGCVCLQLAIINNRNLSMRMTG